MFDRFLQSKTELTSFCLILSFLLVSTLEEITEKIPSVCRFYRIQTVDVFGSIARGDSNENSDIDFLIEFEEPRTEGISERYFGFLHTLEDMFQCRIDVLTSRSLKNPYFIKRIGEEKKRIYG